MKPLRKARLKAVFEGRCKQLDKAREGGWPPTQEETHRYGVAVRKYTEARRAWRKFRGWE